MTIRTASGALGMAAVALLALAAALLLATPVSAAGNQSLTAVPSNTSPNPGDFVTVTIYQDADVTTSGEQVTVDFDHTRLAVTDVQLGPDWTAGNFIIGVAPDNTEPLAIAAANTDGHLRNVAGYYSPPTTVASGSRVFVTVTFQALANGGSAPITLSSAQGIDENGDALTTTVAGTNLFVSGPISVGGFVETVISHDGGSSGLALWAIVLGALGAIAVAGGLGFAGYRVRNESQS